MPTSHPATDRLRRAIPRILVVCVLTCTLSCSHDPGGSGGGDLPVETAPAADATSGDRQNEAGSNGRQPAPEAVSSKAAASMGSSTKSGPGRSGQAAAVTTGRAQQRQAKRALDIDPKQDGWQSEAFASQAGAQLKHIGQMISGKEQIEAVSMGSYVATTYSGSALRPHQRTVAFSDQSVIVYRPESTTSESAFRGLAGAAESVQELADLFRDASDLHFKFKIFRVEPTDKFVKTTVYFEASGRTSAGSIQVNATWNCRWSKEIATDEPLLLSIEVSDYGEASVRDARQTLFSDHTESVFRDVRVYDEQFRPGLDYWRARLPMYLGIYFDGHHGVAVGDVNGDGLEDIYLSEPGGLPNRLFVQQRDGSLADVSARSGVDFLEYTRCALLVDVDNDGDQDLVTPLEGRLLLFSNDGKGRFTEQARLWMNGQTAYSLCSADYDEDGDLDFYACVYHGDASDQSNRLPVPIPYHDARTGGRNYLFRNDGDWKFRNATEEVGLNHNNDRWSFSAVWEDYDNDGDLDLYVANDFGRNNLYRNDEGAFEDVAKAAGAEDMNFGMSASFGDFNRDGWMDLYVSNMFSSAGGRITFQPQFKIDVSSDVRSAYQQMARGNTLLENRRDGTFRDVSSSAGVTMGRWAWGSLFADINNDGWDDLVVTNGFVTGRMPDDL